MSDIIVENVEVDDVQELLTALESDFKIVSASLDAAIKGLKALSKKVKKEGKEDILVSKGPNKGKSLTDALDLAVGVAKTKKTSFGSVVLEELGE
jgi:CO dehydrogenase/acetyl-CoA synthase gamma subunit (corrinoid Fe-S protein)